MWPECENCNEENEWACIDCEYALASKYALLDDEDNIDESK